MNAYIVGVDVGGTKTSVVLGSLRGEIRRRTHFPTEPTRGFRPVFEDIVSHIKDARRVADADVLAVSVSIGGPLNVKEGIIKDPPHLPGWHNIHLKTMLAAESGLPVYVEHDGNAGALAELYFGAGKGLKNIIFLTMGTGFGAGLILNGRLYRGSTDVAGRSATSESPRTARSATANEVLWKGMQAALELRCLRGRWRRRSTDPV